MNQLKRKKFFTILFIVAFIGMMLTILPIFEVKAAVNVVYDSFDDYDTDYDRQGRKGGIYAQIATWGSAAGTNVAEAGDPVGASDGKSLRLKQTSNAMFIAWGKGMKEESALNQSGARYVKVSVRNLSTEARDFGIIVTDILQTTVDSFASAGNMTPDAGQEHWQIGWNQPIVLENADGVKSVVKSVNGSFVNIPEGFEGTVCMPLDKKYIVNPDWWLQEDHDYKNGVLDLERIFMVSFYMPARTDGINFDDPDTWSVFEVDNAVFCSDDSVDEFIEKNGGSADKAVKSVVKAKQNGDVEIDYEKLTVTVPDGTTKKGFINSFDCDGGVNITIKDTYGFVVSDNNSVLQSDMVAEFTKGIDKYTFRIVTVKGEEKGDEKAKSGCKSTIGSCGVMATGCAVGFAGLSLRRRRNRGE